MPASSLICLFFSFFVPTTGISGSEKKEVSQLFKFTVPGSLKSIFRGERGFASCWRTRLIFYTQFVGEVHRPQRPRAPSLSDFRDAASSSMYLRPRDGWWRYLLSTFRYHHTPLHFSIQPFRPYQCINCIWVLNGGVMSRSVLGESLLCCESHQA